MSNVRVFILFLATSSLFAQSECSLEVIAGLGGPLADVGGPALEGELLAPSDARVGPDGLLYIADPGQDVVWRVREDQTIEIFAGTGENGSAGDGGPARAAQLDEPVQLAFGPDGSVYVLLAGEYRIRRIDPNGVIHAYAGDGRGLGSENLYRPGMTAAELPLAVDTDIAVGPGGELYATLPLQHRVVRINSDGTVTPFAGRSETWREYGVEGDGGPATEALLRSPNDITVDPDGNVYIADPADYLIRRVGTDGVIETFAGPDRGAFSGLRNLESDKTGRVYFAATFGLMALGSDGSPQDYLANSGAWSWLSVGPSGDAVAGNGFQVAIVRAAEGVPELIAGIGPTGGFGDGGAAVHARFRGIAGVAVGAGGEIYLADQSLNRVRVIRRDGTVERFAGTGAAGYAGDGGPALQALLHQPADVGVDGQGRVWIADSVNNRIRRTTPAGNLETVAGNGSYTCGSQPFGQPVPLGCDVGDAIDTPVPRPTRVLPTRDGGAWAIHNDTDRWLRWISSDGTIVTVGPSSLGESLDRAHPAAAATRADGSLVAYWDRGLENGLVLSLDTPSSAQLDPDLTAYLPFPIIMAFGPDGTLYVT
ncbi:MAG: hypothetical protein KDC27_20020, partial [Acidobacteria bacterium]|nr:hypothetical protein [Acidobacteriota bacterium]